MDETFSRDVNRVTTEGGVTDDSDQDITQFRVDPITKRLLVETESTDADLLSVRNLSLTTANTEYSTVITAKKFMISSREVSTIFISVEAGTNVVFTVHPGEVYWEDHIELTSGTFYMKSPVGSDTAEIIYWT